MSMPKKPADEPDYGLRALLVLAWPVVVARSTQAIIGFCDAVMTAPLGEAAMAAVTTGAMNAFALIILPMGIIFIVQSMASQFKGKEDHAAARRYAYYGLILTAITGSLAVMATGLVAPVLGLLNLEPLVHTYMTDYMVIRLFTITPLLGIEVLGNWYGGLGNTRIHMAAGLVAMVLNVFLNWLLIQGRWGAPALGVAGAAYASAVASWVSFAGVLALFWMQKFVPQKVRGRLRLRMREFWRMLRFGVPNGINFFFEFAAFTLFINVIVADLGTTVLAAMMAVMAVNSVSFMPAFGISTSGAILVGQAIGSGHSDRVAGIVKRTAGVTMIWQGVVSLVYLAAPAFLMALFTPPGEHTQLLTVGTVLLMISVAWQLFDSVGMSVGEALRAAGDTAWPMWARLGLGWMGFLPAGYLSVTVYGGGHVAAMLCLVGYLALLAVLLVYRFRSGAWRRIDLTGDGVPLH